MEILATATHEMGGEFKLAKVSNDFCLRGSIDSLGLVCDALIYDRKTLEILTS